MANHSTSAARPIRLPIHNHPAAVRSNGPQPEYEFVHSAGSKKAVDADARRTIRSRVMRNYLQEKSGQKQNESFLNSDSTVKASTSLKGRFRLKSREQLEEEERNHRRTRKRRSPIAPAPEDDNPSTSREDTSSTYTNAVVAITNEIIPNQYSDAISVSTARVVQANYTEAQAGQALGDAVAVIPRFLGSRLDPFNSLPVPGGPRLDRLLYFYKDHFYVNSNAVNPTRTWFDFVFSENALFHAMLATVAMVAWKYNGLDTKPDMLYHHGQTLRKINHWLQALDTAPMDLLIATVGTMTSFESLQGNYDTASTHIAAVKNILWRHGGISALQGNDTLQRATGWVAYHYAAAHRELPFYRVEPSITADFPEELLLEAAKSAPTSILNIPSHGFEIYNILHRIHLLGLAISYPWLGNVSRIAVSNTLHEADYDMLALSAQLTAEGETNRTETNVAECLLFASQIFLYSALRLIPLETRTCQTFLQRLMTALERENLLEAWREQCSLEALLWTVCMGLITAAGKPAQLWLRVRMEELVHLLQVADFEDLEGILKNYAWSDYCVLRIKPIWNELALTQAMIQEVDNDFLRD